MKGIAGLLGCALVCAMLPPAPAHAAAGAIGDSATGPRVARISVIEAGSVFVTHADRSEQVKTTVNSPLLAGDVFATSAGNTRAEIQLDGFTSLRLGGGVHGRIAADDANERKVEVSGGLVELAILRGGDVATEIVAPPATLRARYAGDYRIAVDAAGTTIVTPRSGQADVVTPHRTYTLVAGQALSARGVATDPTIGQRTPIARDAFDEFNATRDRALLAALDGDPHVPSSLAGYDDLNQYGRWKNLASYGQVWVPDQTSAWAPYRNGQWTSEPGYGPTWVGNEPWGWIPYHYGSWIYATGNGWCWYPPPLGFQPPWAPGLVGFFGYGTGPLGYSGFGWVPLAPFEAYYPWYPWSWYAGAPNPGRRYYPPPIAPPGGHRQGPPRHMQPLQTAFRNARFGGVSAIEASGWRDENISHPFALDASRLTKIDIIRGRSPIRASTQSHRETQGLAQPVMQLPIPALQLTTPVGVTAPTPSLHVTAPVTRATIPVMQGKIPIVGASVPVMRASAPVVRPIAPIVVAPAPAVHPPAVSVPVRSGAIRPASRPPA